MMREAQAAWKDICSHSDRQLGDTGCLWVKHIGSRDEGADREHRHYRGGQLESRHDMTRAAQAAWNASAAIVTGSLSLALIREARAA